MGSRNDNRGRVSQRNLSEQDVKLLFEAVGNQVAGSQQHGDHLSDPLGNAKLNEKKVSKMCYNFLHAHSIEMNNKNNHIMEKINLNATELATVTNRFNEIHSNFTESETLKGNLVAYYAKNAAVSNEEAEQIITRLMSGVDDLTSKFNQAMEEGWNPAEQVASLTAEMTLEERYKFLLNAIAVTQTLNVGHLADSSDLKEELERLVERLAAENKEVSNETCACLEEMLAELLGASSLMLTGADQVQKMMEAARGKEMQVVDFASAQYDDLRYKCEMALATWIEYQKGSLSSLPEGLIPESLAVSVAAGVEETRVMDQVASGRKPVEWAVKALKILGAVALVCLLGYVALIGLILTVATFFEAAIMVLGTSSVAVFIASAMTFLIGWGFSDVAVKVGNKILQWGGDAYDCVISKLKDDIFPAISEAATRFVDWLRSLFGGQGQSGNSGAAVQPVLVSK